jgi:ABC-2 type transport system ATP-binding protein
MLLEVQALTVRYGKRVAVDRVSLSVDKGEIVGLLGPNGAGKSTALLAIAGGLLPSGGTILVDGVDATRDPLAARARVGIADQPPTLYEFLTVREQLAFVAEARGAAAGAELDELLASLGLAPVSGRLVRELSFG